MAIAFTPSMRERLIAEADAQGISIAEEVRRRLEKSYREDDFNASRSDLGALIQ